MTHAFSHHQRGSMTPARRARLFLAAEGRCQNPECGHKIRPGEDWDVDHILALECGGTDDDDNCQVLCELCHSKKTPDDHETGGKIKRMATRHFVPKRFQKGKGWRR